MTWNGFIHEVLTHKSVSVWDSKMMPKYLKYERNFKNSLLNVGGMKWYHGAGVMNR